MVKYLVFRLTVLLTTIIYSRQNVKITCSKSLEKVQKEEELRRYSTLKRSKDRGKTHIIQFFPGWRWGTHFNPGHGG